MVRKLFGLAAWASVGFIIYATLVPQHLRPRVEDVGPDFERFAAYAVASALMALAYPRHVLRIGLAMVAVAIALELAQLVTPDRDGRVVDTIVKIAGAMVGTTAAVFADKWAVRRGLLAAAMTAG
jgi:VanZ family protein